VLCVFVPVSWTKQRSNFDASLLKAKAAACEGQRLFYWAISLEAS